MKEEKRQENLSELRSFVGLVNNYHRFIDSLSSVAGPLHKLLKKDTKWNWNSNREVLFFKTIKTWFALTKFCTILWYWMYSIQCVFELIRKTNWVRIRNIEPGRESLFSNRKRGSGSLLENEKILTLTCTEISLRWQQITNQFLVFLVQRSHYQW